MANSSDVKNAFFWDVIVRTDVSGERVASIITVMPVVS
jgi:hypothetical protein